MPASQEQEKKLGNTVCPHCGKGVVVSSDLTLEPIPEDGDKRSEGEGWGRWSQWPGPGPD
jgi:hypothetical protein